MARNSLRKLRIKCLEEDAFGLYSVVQNPRSVSPFDVQNACKNVGLEYDGKKPARDVVSLVGYVLAGYFELAHRTGLYNRQKELWESIARVTSCNVNIVRQGILIPVKLPVLDVDFYNSQDVPLLLTRLVKPQKRKDFHKRAQRYLSSFITRVNKVQTRKGTLTGALICYPAPVPEGVIEKVHARVGAGDPVNRFESRLPLPAGISFNVLEMDFGESYGESGASGEEMESADQAESLRMIYKEEELFPVSLVHPDLSAKR